MYILRYLCCYNKKKDTILDDSYIEDIRFSHFLYGYDSDNNDNKEATY